VNTKRYKTESAVHVAVGGGTFSYCREHLKGYFTSGKMNVYLKWVIYVEEM